MGKAAFDKGLDERQLLVRGEIFKHSTFLFIGLLLLEAILQNFFEIAFFEAMWSKILIILAVIMIMGSEMIWRDAYPLSEKGQVFLFSIMGLAGLASLIIGVIDLTVYKKSFIAGNALSESAALLFMSIMFTGASIIFLIKFIKNRNKKTED